MADYYDVEKKRDGGFTVTPRDHVGCGTVIAFIVLFIIIGLLARCDSGAENTPTETPKPTPVISESVQNRVPEPSTAPEPSYLAYLHVIGCDTSVAGNRMREGTVSNAYGKVYNGPYFALTSSYSMSSGWREAYTELVANGEYSYLSGTFFAETKHDGDEIVFRIYVDGALAYESEPMTSKSKPVDFKISIEEGDIIKVAAQAQNMGSTTSGAHIILVDAAVFN